MMNKLTKLDPPAGTVAVCKDFDLEDSRSRILNYHENNLRAAQQQFGYQFLAGLELHRVKESLAHGQFLKWRQENIPVIPERTAQLYMHFAELLISKSATVADLTQRDSTSRCLQLTNGEIPEKEKKIILEAVFEFADGRSLTELYRDLGVIRPPKKQEYAAPKLNAKEKLEAEESHAAELAADAERGNLAILDPAQFAKLTTAAKKQLIDHWIHCSTTAKARLKESGMQRHVAAARAGQKG
jgi:hypothetical protein